MRITGDSVFQTQAAPVRAAERSAPSILLAGNFLSGVRGTRSIVEDLADRWQSRGLRLVTTSLRRPGVLRGLDMLKTALLRRRDYSVAIVDLYSGRAYLWGEALSVVLRWMGRPFVLVLRGGGLPQFAARRPGRVRACLERANMVVAPSPFLVDQMREYRHDIGLLPNPIDIRRYRYRLREQPRPLLIWLRALRYIYNPALAPRVLSLLLPDYPDARLTMVGSDRKDGSLAEVLRTAREMGVAQRLKLPGGVSKEDVPMWLSQGDVFLNTTDVDNTPVSVLEAMACGLCVVSTDVGGMPYLVTDGEDALLTPPKDAEAMADAVRRILKDSRLAARLSANARRTAERFDWETILPQWDALLMGLADMGGRR